MVRAGNYNFSMKKEIEIKNWKQDFLHHRKVSTVKRVDFFYQEDVIRISERSLV
jgi:hypothetical protein